MTLRPMLMSDADKMLEWKNYKETRQFALQTHDEIKKEDHYKWLHANIDYFMVIEWKGFVVGAVRIVVREVSIWIDREYWGYGLASDVLKMVSKPGMTAKVVCGNLRSIRAFMSAGYKPVVYIEKGNYYLFQSFTK